MLQSLVDYLNKVTRGEKILIGDAQAQWKKVSELTEGMLIAVPKEEALRNYPYCHCEEVRHLADDEAISETDVMWDEIVSIKRLSPERVYDIEVEGTHNFVGNGIFAHNTYINLDTTGNVISPLATNNVQVGNLQAGIIAPIPNQDLVINLSYPVIATLSGVEGEAISDNEIATSPTAPRNDNFGRLLVKGIGGQTVASIDSQGNASFSGTLHAQNVILGSETTPGSTDSGQARMTVNGDASITGTLRANRIEANDIVGLKATFADLLAASISATHITNVTDVTRVTEVTKLVEQLATPSASQGNTSEVALDSSDGGGIGEHYSTSSAILASMFPGLASYSAMLADSLSQSSTSRLSLDSLWDITKINQPLTFEQTAVFNDTLSVFGTTTLGQTLVTGPLTQDGTLVFDNGNQIDAIGQTLYIQKLAEAGVDFLNGKVTIAQNGDMAIAGNLAVAGTLSTNEISPLGTSNLVINLGGDNTASSSGSFGQLLVRGVNGEVVASIDTSGSATFANQINTKEILAQAATFGRLTIDTGLSIPEAQAQASSSSEIIANGTIGRAAIATGHTYLIIYNNQLTAQSMIYLTPTSKTSGIAPFISEVVGGSYFRVEIDLPLPQDLTFNWLIVN